LIRTCPPLGELDGVVHQVGEHLRQQQPPQPAGRKRQSSSIRDIKRISHRRFTAEEKIQIILEEFHRGIPIRDLCHRESILRPRTYYV
jgi:hypothetical protein